MRVLIIKTTSLGDVIHTLPAVQDAYVAMPNIVFDWVVESSFAQVPSWHPAVDNIFRSDVRRWRKAPLKRASWQAYAQLKRDIQARHYDLIIDAQGLIKSAWMTRWARGKRVGFGKQCIKEKLATLFYDKTIEVSPQAHAIERVRQLFSQALGYQYKSAVHYGLSFKRKVPVQPTALLLHGTTWPTKHYPLARWRELAENMDAQGIAVRCVWGNSQEHERAQAICRGLSHAEVLPRMGMNELVHVINGVSVVVAVDTGLAHLSAALGVPTLSLYGPTDPARTGAQGVDQIYLQSDLPCAPCFKKTCQISDMSDPLDPPCLGALTAGRIMNEISSHLRIPS